VSLFVLPFSKENCKEASILQHQQLCVNPFPGKSQQSQLAYLILDSGKQE
jgi:hypothetical protein